MLHQTFTQTKRLLQFSATAFWLIHQDSIINNETVTRSPKEQVKLILLCGFAECGFRKALRLKVQGVYSCK